MASHVPSDVSAEYNIDGEYVETYGGTNLSERIRGNDAIRITRGLVDQQSAPSPVNATFTLNNRDGLFTDSNPLSVLYGKFGQNTRARIGVKKGGTWEEYVRYADQITDAGSGDKVSTADKASLDITGDIDIRVEFTANYTRGLELTLISKWATTATNRAWLLYYEADGQLKLWHSPDGTLGAALSNLSGFSLDENTGRIAVRVTLDVNDGAGNRVYRWYTSDSITGTWTLQSSGTVAGVTTIVSNAAAVEIGTANNGGSAFTTANVMCGKIHAAEIYSGIAGTLVADFKPAGQGIGTTTWVDTCASPNTWLIEGTGLFRLASDRIRISGELSSLPENWDKTGRDRWEPVTLSGIMRRLSSTTAPIRSAIYQRYRNFTGITGYWPMEDEPGSTQAASGLPTGRAGVITSCTFGTTTGLDGSAGALTLTSAPNVSSAVLRTIGVPTYTGVTSWLMYFRLDTLPPADTTLCSVVFSGSTIARFNFKVGALGFLFECLASDGTLLDDASSLFGTGASPLDQWLGMQVWMKQEGGNIRWKTAWHAVGTDIAFTTNVLGETFAGTCGQMSYGTLGTPDAAFAGAQIAHFMFANVELDLSTTTFRRISAGWTGETATNRMIRLCEQENVTFEWHGDPDDTATVGPQAIDSLYNNLISAATVDGGLFTEIRDLPGFLYVARRYLGNRRGLELNYSSAHLADAPNPIRDDRYTVNDFTATRPAGSSARYEADDGRRLNVSDPPAGAGRYERSGAFLAEDDDQLGDLAEAQVFLGTWDERRIPNVPIGLHRSEIFSGVQRLADCIALDAGDPISITGVADSPLYPDDWLLLAVGYTERFDGFLWDIVANTVPAGPYQVGTLDNYFNGADYPRLDANSSYVHGSTADGTTVASGSTALIVATLASEPAWIDSTNYSAEFPVDIKVAGERMTLSAMTVESTDASLATGGFENPLGVTQWAAHGGTSTIAQSNTFAFAGTFSARLTVAGSPSQAYIRPIDPTWTSPVVPGASYTLAMQCRITATNNVNATIDWLDINGTILSTSSNGSSLVSGAFAARSVTATAPADAAYAQYGATITGSPANGTLLYVDAVTFVSATYVYQTATVIRAVNGVTKAQVAGSGNGVYLFRPTYVGLE